MHIFTCKIIASESQLALPLILIDKTPNFGSAKISNAFNKILANYKKFKYGETRVKFLTAYSEFFKMS